MPDQDYAIVRKFRQPSDKVWRFLTQADRLARWFLPSDFRLKKGGAFRMWTSPTPGWDGVLHGKVTDYEERRFLAYDLRASNSDQSGTVNWRLSENRGGTTLSMRHDGARDQIEAIYRAVNGTLVSGHMRARQPEAARRHTVLEILPGRHQPLLAALREEFLSEPANIQGKVGQAVRDYPGYVEHIVCLAVEICPDKAHEILESVKGPGRDRSAHQKLLLAALFIAVLRQSIDAAEAGELTPPDHIAPVGEEGGDVEETAVTAAKIAGAGDRSQPSAKAEAPTTQLWLETGVALMVAVVLGRSDASAEGLDGEMSIAGEVATAPAVPSDGDFRDRDGPVELALADPMMQAEAADSADGRQGATFDRLATAPQQTGYDGDEVMPPSIDSGGAISGPVFDDATRMIPGEPVAMACNGAAMDDAVIDVGADEPDTMVPETGWELDGQQTCVIDGEVFLVDDQGYYSAFDYILDLMEDYFAAFNDVLTGQPDADQVLDEIGAVLDDFIHIVDQIEPVEDFTFVPVVDDFEPVRLEPAVILEEEEPQDDPIDPIDADIVWFDPQDAEVDGDPVWVEEETGADLDEADVENAMDDEDEIEMVLMDGVSPIELDMGDGDLHAMM